MLTVSLAYLARSANPLYGSNHETLNPLGTGGEFTARLFKYDLSVRLPHTASLLKDLKHRVLAAGFRLKGASFTSSELESGCEVDGLTSLLSACELEFCNFGHIADQNIHLNVLSAVRTVRRSEEVNGGTNFEVKVLQTAEQRKYLKQEEKIGNPSRDTTVRARRMPGGEVFIEDTSMAEYTAFLKAELDKHIFDLTLAFGGNAFYCS